jgi:hypothetical protein
VHEVGQPFTLVVSGDDDRERGDGCWSDGQG